MIRSSSTVERLNCNQEVIGSNPMAGTIPTQRRLFELIKYDPESGIITWIADSPRKQRIGTRAGRIHIWRGHARRRIVVDRIEYQEHRIIWLYMTGKWPADQIDHIDRDACNNKWSNLRLDPSLKNNQNRGMMSHNTSGFKGVTRRKNGYAAAITIGQYSTPEEAHAAYKSASILLHGEFSPYFGEQK